MNWINGVTIEVPTDLASPSSLSLPKDLSAWAERLNKMAEKLDEVKDDEGLGYIQIHFFTMESDSAVMLITSTHDPEDFTEEMKTGRAFAITIGSETAREFQAVFGMIAELTQRGRHG